MEDEPLVVGVEELVELDPHAERMKTARISKMPIVAFEIVMRRNECIIRIVLSSRFPVIDLSYFLEGSSTSARDVPTFLTPNQA